MVTETVIVKAKYGDNLKVLELPLPLQIHALSVQIKRAFSIEQPSRFLRFTYVDSDGDAVLLSSNADLNLAVRRGPLPLRLTVGVANEEDMQSATGQGRAQHTGDATEDLSNPKMLALFTAACENLATNFGVKLTPSALFTALQLLRIRPRALINRGLAPRSLLHPNKRVVVESSLSTLPIATPVLDAVPMSDSIDTFDNQSSSMYSSAYSDVHSTGIDDDVDQEELEEEHGEGTENGSAEFWELIASRFMAAGVPLTSVTVRPFLVALGCKLQLLVRVGLIDKDTFRAHMIAQKKAQRDERRQNKHADNTNNRRNCKHAEGHAHTHECMHDHQHHHGPEHHYHGPEHHNHGPEPHHHGPKCHDHGHPHVRGPPRGGHPLAPNSHPFAARGPPPWVGGMGGPWGGMGGGPRGFGFGGSGGVDHPNFHPAQPPWGRFIPPHIGGRPPMPPHPHDHHHPHMHVHGRGRGADFQQHNMDTDNSDVHTSHVHSTEDSKGGGMMAKLIVSLPPQLPGERLVGSGVRGVDQQGGDNRDRGQLATLPAGSPFRKAWIVRNDSPTDWAEEVDIVPGRGGAIFLPPSPSLAVGGVREGEEAEVSIRLTAPTAPGVYRGIFRLKSVTHGTFGQRLPIDVKVE